MTANRAGRSPQPAGVVTSDVFSALIDSRQGGSAYFNRVSTARGWPMTGQAV